MLRRCRRRLQIQARMPTLPLISSPLILSSLYTLTRLGPQQPDDQVQPLNLTPGVLVVELRPRPDALQAAMLLGVEQAVEIEARCPLVLSLQDGLGIVQADPPNILGELAVGSHQFLGGGAKQTVGRVNLFDERVVGHRRFPPRLWRLCHRSGPLTVSVRTLAGQHHNRNNKWRRLTARMTEAKNGLIVHSPLH